MKHPPNPGGKIAGAVIGCVSGQYVGFALGVLLIGLIAGQSAEPTFGAKALFYIVALAGPVSGGFLGAFVGVKPVVAWWSLGTSLGLGAVSLVGGIAMWPHDQGPILGIFIIAPLGFALGAIIGTCIGLVNQGRKTGF